MRTFYILLLLLMCNPLWAGEKQARVVAVRGKVSLTDQTGTRSALTLKGKVSVSDQIETAADGMIQLLLTDGTLITLRENSHMTLSHFSYSAKAVSLELKISKGGYRICPSQAIRKSPVSFKLITPQGKRQFNAKSGNSLIEGQVEKHNRKLVAIGPIKHNHKNVPHLKLYCYTHWQDLTYSKNFLPYTIPGYYMTRFEVGGDSSVSSLVHDMVNEARNISNEAAHGECVGGECVLTR